MRKLILERKNKPKFFHQVSYKKITLFVLETSATLFTLSLLSESWLSDICKTEAKIFDSNCKSNSIFHSITGLFFAIDISMESFALVDAHVLTESLLFCQILDCPKLSKSALKIFISRIQLIFVTTGLMPSADVPSENFGPNKPKRPFGFESSWEPTIFSYLHVDVFHQGLNRTFHNSNPLTTSLFVPRLRMLVVQTVQKVVILFIYLNLQTFFYQ